MGADYDPICNLEESVVGNLEPHSLILDLSVREKAWMHFLLVLKCNYITENFSYRIIVPDTS